MTRTIEAVYERGVLRLLEQLPLEEGTTVEITLTDFLSEKASPGERHFHWQDIASSKDDSSISVADEVVRQREME